MLDRQGANGDLQGYTYGQSANIVTESDEDMLATVAHEIAHCYGVGDEYGGGSIHMSVNPAPLGMGGTDWDSSEPITANNSYFKPFKSDLASQGVGVGEGSSIEDEVPFDFTKCQQLTEKASFMGSGCKQEEYWVTAPIWKQLFQSFEPESYTNAAVRNLADVTQ